MPSRHLLGVALCLTTPWLFSAANAQTLLVLQPGSNIATLVGNGSDRTTEAGKAALDASVASPRGLTYDTAGNLYIADSRNHIVSRRDISGVLSIIAGNGRQGFAGDGGPAASAELNAPSAVAFDTSGNLWIADTGNHCIRRVEADGTVHTVAGTGLPGFGGDGGPATAALLRLPSAIAVSTSNDVYIADTGNHRIRKWSSEGKLTTVAGSGEEGDDGDGGPALSASFEAPSGLTFLPDGRLLISDRAAHRLRTLQPDGTIAAYNVGSSLLRPESVAADATGSVYLADASAQNILQSSSDGTSILAGSGEQATATTGSPLATALDSPAGIAPRNTAGEFAVSDRRNHQVQQITLPRLDFGEIPAGQGSQVQNVTLQNGGATMLQVLAVTLPSGFTLGTGVQQGCGTTPFSLQVSGQCVLPIVFHPTIQGSLGGLAQVRISGAAPRALLLTGTGSPGTSLAASSITLQTNGNVSYLGTPATLTSAVSGTLATPPTGNVVFFDGNNAFATTALTSGTATLTTATLQQGTHALHAVYSGDGLYSTSSSATVSQIVAPAPDFVLTGSSASYSASAGASITVPMTLQPVNGSLGHSVQFTVTGLPNGATTSITPISITLVDSPVAVTLNLQLPATISQEKERSAPLSAALLLSTGICCWSLRRRRSAVLLGLTAFCVLTSAGCAGALRSDSSSGPSGSSTTHSYTVTVTATTTGVTGNTLVHSTSFGLTVAP